MKKIFILTNFSTWLKSYSPIIIVGSQIKMLTDNGYQPVLIASEGWDPPEDSVFTRVETKRIFQPRIDGQDINEEFEAEVSRLHDEINAILEDNSVVITHDLIFLPDYVKHNVACRRIAEERPSIRWLHWVHSATGPGTLIKERSMFEGKYNELLNSAFPNSLICYPNAEHIPRVAKNFGFEEYNVVEVPHATDPVEGMHPLVQRLYEEKKLYEAEILTVYPIRLDRGKAAHMHVRFMKGCLDAELSSHVIYCDFQSTGGDKVKYREDIKELAKELGVEDRVTFLSEFDESAQLEVPHKVILDLFTLSNVFLLPSRSETYSLITQEAMMKGNLCILNQDFSPFRQIFGQNALYRQYDGAEVGFDGFDGKIDTSHSNIEDYFKYRFGVAIKGWLGFDKVFRGKTWVRTQRNPQVIFKNYLEPLLHHEETQV